MVGEIDKQTFIALRNIINQSSGIWLSDSKVNFLKLRLQHRMSVQQISSAREYYYFLKYDPGGKEELQRLIEAVTVNETYFYRYEEQFKALKEQILPELIKKKSYQFNSDINIWSAACSTGEEAYSLAINVLESINHIYLDKVKIFASDISRLALKSARQAVYPPYSLRRLSQPLVEKYFTRKGKLFEVNKRVRKLVNFRQINLIDPNIEAAELPPAEIIFCRNVIMYMDIESRQKVITNLAKVATDGGILFLGESETLRDLTSLFELRRFGNVLLYQYPEKAVSQHELKEAG